MWAFSLALRWLRVSVPECFPIAALRTTRNEKSTNNAWTLSIAQCNITKTLRNNLGRSTVPMFAIIQGVRTPLSYCDAHARIPQMRIQLPAADRRPLLFSLCTAFWYT